MSCCSMLRSGHEHCPAPFPLARRQPSDWRGNLAVRLPPLLRFLHRPAGQPGAGAAAGARQAGPGPVHVHRRLCAQCGSGRRSVCHRWGATACTLHGPQVSGCSAPDQLPRHLPCTDFNQSGSLTIGNLNGQKTATGSHWKSALRRCRRRLLGPGDRAGAPQRGAERLVGGRLCLPAARHHEVHAGGRRRGRDLRPDHPGPAQAGAKPQEPAARRAQVIVAAASRLSDRNLTRGSTPDNTTHIHFSVCFCVVYCGSTSFGLLPSPSLPR